MPASDHGSEAETIVNGSVSTTTKTSCRGRAEELQDLIDAVKALVVPHVRAADENAHHKPTGRLPRDTATGRLFNVLLPEPLPLPPQALSKRMTTPTVNVEEPSQKSKGDGDDHGDDHVHQDGAWFALPDGQGRGRDGLLDSVAALLRHSVNTWDQGWMDKLTASTNPVGVVTEMVLAVLNTNVHVYRAAPALTVVEKAVARALAARFGLTGRHAGGISCQGGSAANLTSLVIARGVLYPETREYGNQGRDDDDDDHHQQPRRFVVFTSAASHYSVDKAAVACGIGAANVISVPVDSAGRMSVAHLSRLVADSRARGHTPLYVNATAGTTVMGAFDPLRAIRRVCDEHGMWMHVDGAWGGSVAFSRRHRHRLDGAHLADSLAVNPQKMLNVPMTCSFLLTRDLRRFHTANSLRAGYLFHDDEEDNDDDDDYDEQDEVWDLADLTMQCGRRADGLKLALAWIYYGAAGFERGIDHAYAMAVRLADLVAASPDFYLVSDNPTPCLQVCFYYAPGGRLRFDDPSENTRRTRAMAAAMVARGFMFDYAPGPYGSFFRVVTNCQTQPGTIDGLFRGLSEVGKEIVPQG